MEELQKKELWFIVGSQVLYGPEVLQAVENNARTIVAHFNAYESLLTTIHFAGVVKSKIEVSSLIATANQENKCVGLIFWMHTFSPGQMWIAGLQSLQKPFLHLHTQFNRDIPWSTIDMDFMNLNQSAHGDREFGHICTRLGLRRKIVVGHWQNKALIRKISDWSRVACALDDQRELTVARIGDNMREVSVTQGDQVAAHQTFGYVVNGYGLGDVVSYINTATDTQVQDIIDRYHSLYAITAELDLGGARREALVECARIEAGLRTFLDIHHAKAFTDTFENLHGLHQLPGLPVQQLMSEGYGFGAEGDWKTASLVRALKAMGAGRSGGSSFMEDYTYHFEPNNNMVLGAHMLEVCPSISKNKPEIQISPLSIGSKSDPVRLVFDAAAGPAINVSLVDLGDRFRIIINEIDVIDLPEAMPKLPVARALWKPKPSLDISAEKWIEAGGAHHTCFSQSVSVEQVQDLALHWGLECIVIC